MDFLVDIFTSSGLGSIVGMAGGLFQKFVDLKAKRLEFSHDIKMRQFDVEESKLEMAHQIALADKQIDIAEAEGEIQIESKEADAFVESQKNAGKNSWLTFIRASITLYLLIITTMLSIFVWHKVGGLSAFSPEELTVLLKSIVGDLFFLLVTCVCWWFAARDGNLRFKK